MVKFPHNSRVRNIPSMPIMRQTQYIIFISYIGADPVGFWGSGSPQVLLWGLLRLRPPQKFYWNNFNIIKIGTKSGFVSLSNILNRTRPHWGTLQCSPDSLAGEMGMSPFHEPHPSQPFKLPRHFPFSMTFPQHPYNSLTFPVIPDKWSSW